MFDRIIHAISNIFLLFALAILTVNGSKDLEELTGHILVRISFPLLAVGTLAVIKDAISKEDDC